MATTKSKSDNKFVIDLSGMTLTDEERAAIAAAIQGAVLSHLATTVKLPVRGFSLTLKPFNGMKFVPDSSET